VDGGGFAPARLALLLLHPSPSPNCRIADRHAGFELQRRALEAADHETRIAAVELKEETSR